MNLFNDLGEFNMVDDINRLPNFNLRSAKGIVTELFRHQGISDFHSACSWIQSLSYGLNSDESDSTILFKTKQATCTEKHGVIARLAAEHEIAVNRVAACYRLDDEILVGVSSVLDKYRLPFIPEVHCLLEFNNRYVDLTQGNCHGKKQLPERYDLIVQVKADMTDDEKDRFYHWLLDYYISVFPELGEKTAREIVSIRQECKKLWVCRLDLLDK